MKRNIAIILLMAILLTACGTKEGREINLVSREEGSGTRSAFVELSGVLEGEEDRTYEEAVIQNSTEGVITTVSNDELAIGYISLGSLNEEVKPLKIEGVEVNQENIKNESYTLARPFILAYKEENPLIKDFFDFVLSKEGQEIVESLGYVPLDTENSYESSNLNGELIISGSTSVTPLMEKLKEEYERLNSKLTLEIQSNGSSTGINSTIEGVSHIAMSSRDLKDEELKELEAETIARDGIAVIVNKDNSIDTLTLEEIQKIYLGEIKSWEELGD